MTKYKIKHSDSTVLFEKDAESLKQCIEAAVADLRGANLSYADLHGATLSYAYLYSANLSGADLRGAKGIKE
jgi:uncharacterized protein YjbI with pentapeptide repeats